MQQGQHLLRRLHQRHGLYVLRSRLREEWSRLLLERQRLLKRQGADIVTTRTLLALGALAAAAVTATAVAPATGALTAPTATPVSCGTITAAGKTWRIAAVNVPCATAKSVVRRVAVINVPAALVYPGMVQGMRCVGRPPAGRKPVKIICANPPRLVDAVAKSQ
jgi:hypothetical protein